MKEKYVPKHSTFWYQKLHRNYIDWENELYDSVTGALKVYWNKIIIWLYGFTDFLIKCIDKHDKIWDKIEEKIEDFYENYILNKF